MCAFVHIEFIKLELILIGHYYHNIYAFLIELYNCIYVLFINLLLILEDYRKLLPKNLKIREIRSINKCWLFLFMTFITVWHHLYMFVYSFSMCLEWKPHMAGIRAHLAHCCIPRAWGLHAWRMVHSKLWWTNMWMNETLASNIMPVR